MNNKEIRILCLEDIANDAILIREQLRGEGLIFQLDHVSSELEYTEKLRSVKYDTILSDYNLPGFSGIASLLTAKKICPEVPFICVSGTIGEELAVELMHLGASDYIPKDKLHKLNVSILHSLKEAREHKSRIEAEVLLKESEARFRDIVMSTYDWVWEIDSDRKYTFSSVNIENILGYTHHEVIGKSIFEFMTEDEKKSIGPILMKAFESRGIIKDLEHWNIHKDGQNICLLTNGFPIFDNSGNEIGYRGVDKDITKSKNLTIELIQAKEKAEASDRLKTAFMNNISHEVRTPLNGIMGFAEFIIKPDLPHEEKETYLRILNESSERLVNTITNYMDISLIVSGNMNIELNPVDIAPLLSELYEIFLPRFKGKNLEFINNVQPDFNLLLNCDINLLEKAISHILDNALKFTQNGSVTFGSKYTNKVYEIFITDTGTGIEQEDQNKIFQAFWQEDINDTRAYEGSGLGLSIAKGLIELMNGSITLKSTKGMGSSFYIMFPTDYGLNEEIKRSDNINHHLKYPQQSLILIAEDDITNASLLKTILEKNSLKYLFASNGKEAVELCQNNSDISIVLMDIKMPVMDGIEATRMIKAFRKDLPIIALTAYAMIGDKGNALEAGCDDYLTKPVKADYLLSVINKLV